MWKVQVCCCFEDFEQRRCFPWYSVSKSTHWHLPEKGKTKSALSSSFPSSAPKRNEKRLLGPCCPRANDCTMLQQPPWPPTATLITPSVERGRRKGHVVCTFGLLTTSTGLEKLFFWESVVHLAFKNLLCFLFFVFFFYFLKDKREANFPQWWLSRIFPLLYNWVAARQF